LDPKDAVFIAVEGDGLAMLLEVTFRRQSVAEKTLAFDMHIPVMSHTESGPCRTVRGEKSAVVGIVP
jgi:hypothetical protein